MNMLSRFIPFVNEQFTFHEKMAERFAIDPKRAQKHRSTAIQFKELITAIESLNGKNSAQELAQFAFGVQKPSPNVEQALEDATAKKTPKLYLDLDEIEGLPEELIQELSVSEGDKIDYVIIRSVDECGGVASIDRILLSLYRKTNDVMKRSTLTSRIYRLVQKGQLYNVPNRKGVYSLRELTAEESQRLD